MGAKSHRSTLTLFHQWPHHHPSSGSSTSSPTSPTTPISSAKQHHPQHPRLSTVATPGTPDSPSQLDPFNNNATHPSPLISLPSNPSSRVSCRPASSAASLSSRTGRQVSRPGSDVSSSTGTAPKIVLASPSTSTIHYLFPSETRSNLSADRLPRGSEGRDHRGGTVRRSRSAAGERERERRDRPQRQAEKGQGEDCRSSDRVPPRPLSRTLPLGRAVPTARNQRSDPHPPSKSCDSIKHLSTGTLGITLGRPAKTATNPLGPAKRVVSGSGAPPSAPTTSVTVTKAPVKKSDISGPISVDPKSPAKSYGPMRTIRRQPSMADLGRGGARGLLVEVEDGGGRLSKSASVGRASGIAVVRKGGMALSESWGNKAYVRASESFQGEAHKQDGIVSLDKVAPTTSHELKLKTADSTPTPRQLRRRSKSLNSPCLSPPSPSQSPVLPAPDFGNPLTLSDVIPSPSFSHLDYSTAGSSSAGPSRRSSNAIGLFTKHASAIFPSSVPMERGVTRRGLGSYDSGKATAREDAAKRVNGDAASSARRKSQIGRSISLKRKDELSKPRSRSQSLSSRSVREMVISPPVPPRSPHRDSPRKPSDTARGIYLGDLSVDLGGRFHCDERAPKAFYPNSPMSTDTTLYPSTSPSSGFVSLPPIDRMNNTLTELRVMGRPLHPAFANTSEISLLAPSTVGLGFSPIGTPVSLPSSLEAEAIDVTETGRRLSALSTQPPAPSTPRAASASPQPVQPVSAARTNSTPDDTASASRAAMLSQNTYYIPPVHSKPVLRFSKSSGPGTMRGAFTFGNLAVDESCSKPSSGAALAKSPSIISKRSKTDLRVSTTGTTRSKRPPTGFSLCSPPGAIDPLPPVDRSSPTVQTARVPGTEPSRLRSKPSSPFLAASTSLRVFFGREGFVARSLSGAFDRDPRAEAEESSLKSRISSPIGVAGRKGTVSKTVPSEADGTMPRAVEDEERSQTWRRNVLAQAVSLSMSTSLNRLPESAAGSGSEVRIVQSASSSKPRLGIPAELLAAGDPQNAASWSSPGGAAGGGSRRNQQAPRESVPELMVEGLSPGRTVVQVGRDESMASASVYSNYAPTARESPGSRLTAQDSPGTERLTSRWSPSPVRKSKKGQEQPRPTISSPLPLFTPAHPSRLGLGALEPICTPPTMAPYSSPAPTVVENERAAASVATRKSPSVTNSRFMSIMRRLHDSPARPVAAGERTDQVSPPPPPSLTSPSTFSLSLLRSPRSLRSQKGLKLDATTKGISSEMVRNGEVQFGSCGAERGAELVAMSSAVSAEDEGCEGVARGVLDELVAREEEGSDTERAKEEKMRKVLTWRRGVGSVGGD